MNRASQIGLNAHRFYPLVARVRDVLVGSSALILVAPFAPVLAMVVRRSTGGTALFHQVRVGIDRKTFTVKKFRTLPWDAPEALTKKQAEDLATPIGRLMRRFKLDELPQFWSVVKGDMSLVGPRPIVPAEYEDEDTPLRLAVPPGLTGLWQLSPFRDQPFNRNPEYDLFYLANRSIAFDLWLIWRTALLIVSGRETNIHLAAHIWERNPAWRQLVPERAQSIPRSGSLRSRVYLIAGATLLIMFVMSGFAFALTAQ